MSQALEISVPREASKLTELTSSTIQADNMNRCAYQQQRKVGVVAAEMMRGGDAASDGVVCPKPRRIGLLPRDPFRPSPLLHINNQQMEAYDAKAGNELLDIILSKGAYSGEKSNFQVASSPPFFSGSPPTRASNPVIQDEQFGNSKLSPLTPVFEPSASPSSRKSGGGCARAKYGHSPAPIRRIEGFNCRNSCSIYGVA